MQIAIYYIRYIIFSFWACFTFTYCLTVLSELLSLQLNIGVSLFDNPHDDFNISNQTLKISTVFFMFMFGIMFPPHLNQYFINRIKTSWLAFFLKTLNIIYILPYIVGFFIIACALSVGLLFGFTLFIHSTLLGYGIDMGYLSLAAFAFTFYLLAQASDWFGNKFFHKPAILAGNAYKKIWAMELTQE